MKEFKFWAITYTFKQMLLIAVPIWIIFIAIIFFIDMDKYFFYAWIGAFIWIVFCFLFIIKRVRITFSERKQISIYISIEAIGTQQRPICWNMSKEPI